MKAPIEVKAPGTATETAGGVEWFAAWLPKPAASVAQPVQLLADQGVRPVGHSSFFDEVRVELKAVTDHLIDPSAAGVRASLPYLERAIAIFQNHIPFANLPAGASSALKPSIDSLCAELALANRLFENAYTLQAGWASQLGLNMDGTARQLLYSRPGDPAGSLTVSQPAAGTWEG